MTQKEKIENLDKQLELLIEKLLVNYKEFGDEWYYVFQMLLIDYLKVVYPISNYEFTEEEKDDEKIANIKNVAEIIDKLYLNNTNGILDTKKLNKYVELIFANKNAKKII